MNTHPRPISERMMACFRMEDLTPREQIILAILAYYDGDGGAWPSLAKLASQAKIARSTVADVVRSLRAKGRIRVTRGRTTNRYIVAYDAPFETLSVRRNPTVKNKASVSGRPVHTVSGRPGHELRLKGASMETNKQSTIGFCRGCGIYQAAGQEFCVACGCESKPFFMTADERARGEIELPFGLVASGLDTPAGRQLFMSKEGQAALQDAYRVLFADDSVVH